jgi:hypothetical protein
MEPRRRIVPAIIILSLIAVSTAYGKEPHERIEITGDYRYALHEPESLGEAQSMACREAWRMAVLNSHLYQDQTSSVSDSLLLQRLAYTLATGQVQDQQIVEQTQRGRTIRCRVHGYLPAEETARTIRTQLAGSQPQAAEQNRALRIVNSKEEGGYVYVQFEALRRLDWLNTAYPGTLRESADIMVDFYDRAGMLIKVDRFPARYAGSGQNVLNPGMLGLLKLPAPLGTASYRVWVVQ